MTTARPGIKQLARDFKERLHEQPRLRLGLWVVLFILALQGVWSLSDHRQARIPEIQRLADQHDRIQSVLASTDWDERAEQARELRQALQQRVRRAESRGLARAELENLLLEAAGRHGLDRVRLEIRSPVELDDGLTRLGAQLEFDHRGQGVIDLISELITLDQPIQVNSASTTSVRPARAQLDLSAPFYIGIDQS